MLEMICLTGSLVVGPVQDSAAATRDEPPGLQAIRLYNPAEQAALIRVTSSRSFGNVELVLLDANGVLVDGPVEVRPGIVDLNETLPVIWQLRRAGYVQMMVGETPVGSSLVLQPMLERLSIQTEQAVRESGAAYTRIIGWGAEPTAEADDTTNEDTTDASDDIDALLVEAFFSGLRIYADRDVLLETDHGDIIVALRPDEAPNTAWNFRQLAKDGFYDGLTFHRVVPYTAKGDPFVIQGGDPTGTGEGGPGYWLPMEPSRLAHEFGVISMARADHPDSASSQFFFCLSREGTARLDGQYCSFGYAVQGGETILSIAATELADVQRGRPAEPPVIEQAILIAGPPRTPGVGRPDARVTVEESSEEDKPERVGR